MSAQQRTLSRKSALSLFVTTVSVMTFGGALEGQAQVDLNTQERLLQFNLIPLVPSTTDVGPLVCKTDVDLILHLWKHDAPDLGLLRLSDAILRRPLQLGKPISEDELKQKLNANKAIAANILQEYFQTRDASLSDRAAQRAKLLALPGFPITFCEHQGTVTQPTTVKISFPFTSTYETNVLKSNQNVSSGTSSGLGGTLQMITAGLRPYDVMALSAGTTSVRYNKFSSKSFAATTTQGAYQFFLDAFDSTGAPIPGTDGRPIDPKLNIPPPNMITVDAVAFGFQNQTSYRPTFHRETIDLFTPQVTLSRQNWSLAGKDADNRCWTRSQDPRKDGFCHYIDLSLTVGQTFSDVKTQQNAKVAVLTTPGS